MEETDERGESKKMLGTGYYVMNQFAGVGGGNYRRALHSERVGIRNFESVRVLSPKT